MSRSRRQFLADMAKGACGVGLLGVGLGGVARQQVQAVPAQALRPPAALDEAEFLGACVRCGLCVLACPYDTLKLARLFEPVTTGTPYFKARAVPCEMCDDIPCVAACPSGALDRAMTDIDQARMGWRCSSITRPASTTWGCAATSATGSAPIDKAITLELQHNPRTGKHAMFLPTVHSDLCTGCGKCEHACVLEEAAIKVVPRQLAKGELGHHYRLGWEEKAKAGKSLIGDD